MKGGLVSRAVFWAVAFPAGFVAGVFMHYGLYRLMLTIEPFIYVSF